MEKRWTWGRNVFRSSWKFLQPSSTARDTNKCSKSIESKGFSNYITVLKSNTYEFNNVYVNPYYKGDYLYEVNLIIVKDYRGVDSIINKQEFKEYVKEEYEKYKNISYDLDYNIRDLYDIKIHTENKNVEDVERFNELNKIILSLNSRISRRVTKKKIVYKKDKSLSIISVQISKRNYLKLFVKEYIKEFDEYMKFIEIPKSNCKPLNYMMKVRNAEELKYAIEKIRKYIQKVLK